MLRHRARRHARPARSASRPAARPGTATSDGEPVPGTFAPEDELAAIAGDAGRGRQRACSRWCPPASAARSPATPPTPWSPSWSGSSARASAPTRPITFLVMETARGRPLAAVVRRRPRGQRPRRPAPPAGRQPLLRRADGAPVEAQPVPVPAHLPRRARPPAAPRAGRAAARPRDPAAHPRRGARLQRAVPMDQIGRRALDHVFAARRPARLRAHARRRASGRSRARRGVDPWEVAYDVLLEADGHEFLLWPLLNYGSHSYDGLLDMMEDPDTVHGLGDGGAHVGLVCDASMTTYMLTHWVRDRTRGRRLPLEHAVRRLTSEPAEPLRPRRPRRARARASGPTQRDRPRRPAPRPARAAPRPARRRRPPRPAGDGYVATFVAGVQTIDHDERTDALPGRLVRGAR